MTDNEYKLQVLNNAQAIAIIRDTLLYLLCVTFVSTAVVMWCTQAFVWVPIIFTAIAVAAIGFLVFIEWLYYDDGVKRDKLIKELREIVQKEKEDKILKPDIDDIKAEEEGTLW